MSGPAISVEDLGKVYRIGGARKPHDTFFDDLKSGLTNPFRRLRKTLQRDELFWALRNLSFEVNHGEVLGIIGRNGAGKSTLLKILSRVTEPSEGCVRMRGRLGSLLEVGTGFHPELTGRDNIFLNGAILGMRRDEINRKFDEIVAFSGIEKFLDTPVKRYSSGMFVRLAFAVAAHLEPEILVVDEVLAVGDAEFQRKCLGKMNEVAEQGRTILFVSHNMPVIKRLCSRALLIDDGHLKMNDQVDKVVSTYLQLADNTNGKGQVSENASRVGNGQGLLRSIILMDRRDHPIQQIFLGQPLRLSLYYQIKETIEDAAIEVGISSTDGLRIATVCTLDEEGPPLRLMPGVHKVTVEIDVTLLPGEYTVDAFLQSLSINTTVDCVERILHFTAVNVAEVGNDHYHWGQVRGFIRPKSTWNAPLLCDGDRVLDNKP